MPDNFTGLDLGKDDYQSESGNDDILGLSKFTSKPSPKPYQPFGGPIQQAPQTFAQPQYYEQPKTPEPKNYNVFSDDELDTYERAKKDYSYVNNYATSAGQIASKRKANYDEFMKGKLMPFFEQIGGFGEFDDDDELAASIDEMESLTKATSQMDDGWFGPSDEKVAAGENLKNFKLWSSPNGLRDQYRRLRAERDRYQGIADAYKSEKIARLEQLTSIPIPAKQALDEALKSRGKKSSSSPAKKLRSGSGSSKDVNSLLDGMQFEQPMYDGSGLANPESVDPRSSVLFDDIYGTEKKRQTARMDLANRGDVQGLLSRRQYIARERQLRDKGFFFSESGLLDGRPIGLSRRDVDLLDIDDMRKAGMTSYQGRPLDEAMAELGGEERLEMAKVMESVYSAKSNYEDAQLKFLKVSGSAGASRARKKMDEAREAMEKSIGLAAGYGLDNELFEQAETTGWLSSLGNAIDRGMLMSEMSNYTPDFLTNTLDADEMQRFIEIASEMEKLPTSSTMKRYKESDKSGGLFDAIGKLLFDNTGAIPELFFESMSAFLPSTLKWLIPSAGAGAAVGSVGGLPGMVAGAKVGAGLSFGTASFVLEASGMALESMQELNIDWKNPKVFAAAWTNESIRNKIQKKMAQKGIPIAIADAMSGMMAGKVMGVLNHTGNAMFKGGKLLNKEAFNKSVESVPRFTLMQKTKKAAAEIGADSVLGMGGEFLGQWASKESGEAWDWDAVAAEGVVGIGPGFAGAALSVRSSQSNYFGNAPIEISGEENTEVGTRGTITRAGYNAPYQTFNDADSMMAHFEDIVPQAANPEEQDRRAASLDFTRRWVNTMFKIRPEAMAKLKVAISPRTPDANLKNRGTFESRDGHDVIYLNEQEFAADPMGTMLHESGHFARILLLEEGQLMKLWGGLKDTEQLDAYAQYYTKEYEKSFEDHDEKTQKKIQSAFNKTDNEILAEEWFSYQWAKVIDANYKPDKSVKELEKFYSGLVRPLFAEYTGTENTAGKKSSKADDEYIIDRVIQRFLADGFTPNMQYEVLQAQEMRDNIAAAYEEGFTTQKEANRASRIRNKIPSQLQQKLKSMGLAPKKAAQVARTLNAMAGEKILSTDPSFYTPMNRAAVAAMGADIEEGKPESEKRPENQDPTFIEEAAIGYESNVMLEDSPRSEDHDKFGGENPLRYPKRSSAAPKTKKSSEDSAKEIKLKENLKKKVAEYNPINQRLLKLQQKFKSKRTSKEAKKKLSQKIDSIKPEADKLRSEIDQIKKDIDGLYTPLTRKTSFQARDAEMKRLDSLLKNMSESDRIKIEQMIKGIERSFQDLDQVDKKIDAAIEALGGYFVTDPGDRPTPFRKGQLISKDKYEETLAEGPPLGFTAEKGPGPNASSGQIISQILNLEELTKLAPRSFTEEMRNLLQESRMKMATNEDIEDISLQITEEIYGIKEQLRSRRDEIDKEIASLEKGLGVKPSKNMPMNFTSPKNGKKRDGVEGNSTMDWIRNGSRTATTRTKSQVAGIKVGDVIAFNDGKETLNVRVTKAPYPVENVSPEEWSKLESWDASKYEEQKGKYQFQYALIKTEAQKPKEKVEGQRIEDEIKALNKAKDWVELFLRAVAPEDLTIDWKDIPARGIYYAANGKAWAAEQMTLGMLAVRDEAFGKDQLFIKKKDEKDPEVAKNEDRTGVELLWDHINKFSLEKSGKTQEFGTDPDGKKITPRKYELYLEAAKASAFYPQSAKPNEDGGVGSNPMGAPRFEKTEAGNVEAQKGYPAGFQSEKGTNYAALIAERLKNKKRRSSLSNNPSPTEILALKMANGRSLELLGDPSETERDFNKAMYIALIVEEDINQSGIEDLIEQTDYAAGGGYERSALEQISMGTPVVAAMAGIPSVSKRKQIQETALDADAQSAVTDRSATGKKDRPDESSPVWEDYGKEGRKKDTPKVKRKETKEAVLNTNGFQVPSEKIYQAKRPNEDLNKPVRARFNAHEEFTRGKIYQTFDVISAFAKGRSEEEINSFGLGWSKKLPKFNKRRTNIQKSEELPANPISMSRDQADLLSTTDINAADFAEWYMSGKPEEQMANLQLVPSSKNNQQAKGGLGEGMLPFVFFEFAQNMYDKLGLKNRQAMYKKAREAEEAVAKDKGHKYHNFQWDLEKGKLLKGGKLDPDIKVFVNKNKRFSPVGMAVLARPIVQAVIDAKGVDIYNQIDKNESAILARDIERGEQSIERDDSGNEDTQVAEKAPEIDQSAGAPKASNTKFRKGSPTLDAIAADRRKTLIREEFDKIKERVGISKKNSAILAEATKIADQKIQRELDSSMTENFKKAQQSSKPKTLNSDAGRVYHGTRTNLLGSLINSAGDLVFKPSSNFGGKVTGVSFSNDQNTAEDYRTRSKTRGTKGRDLSQGWLIDIDPSALQEATYPLAPTDEIDNELFFRTNEDIVIPQGSWGATKDGIRVTSKEGLDRINSKSAKAADAKMRGKSTEALVKVIVDTDNTSALNEYYQYDESTDYTDSDAAARELRMRGISKDKLTKLFNKFSQAEAINPSDYADSVISPKTLNSDARTLTSDADPNLSKLSILTRLASAKDEYKKDAKAWAKAKKESLKEGSFKMNLVDRADPLKQYHRGIFKVLKKAGLDEKSKLYSFLNTHGRYHQYFGKGYNTVEQAQLNYIQPLKDLLREYGISQTDFGRYLIARAAPSRNLQLKARIDEMLADFAKEEKGGVNSEAYEKERAKYYDGNTLKVNSGLDTDTAVETVKEIEANVKNFKQFAEKALPIYYAMNLESLNNLTQSGMIQEGVATIEGKPAAMKEETAMVRAMSRYKWAEEHPDVVQVDWSILDTPPPKGAESYSYAPLQGFEGETEQYFDNEAAWEEFGAGSNATGKGMDQPKSKILLKGAFGRDGKTKGPNPDLVFANSINQFFDNSIRAHKNEVAQSFGTLYESILRIVYPEKAKEFEGENIEARNKAADKTILTIEQALGDNREALVKELKKEFDKIFEPEFKEYEIKKMYEVKPQTLAEGKTGDAKIMAVTRTLSTQFREDPTVFVYRRDGVPKFIKLKETPEGLRMADAMKNLKYETLPSVLNFFNIGTRGMAQMFTSMNPAFLIPNFFRDIGTAAIHLSEDHKKKIWKDAMNLKTVGTYVKAIIKAEVKIGSNVNPQKDPEIRELMKLSAEELAKAKGPKADIARYQYAKKQGSKIGYFRHKSVPDLIQEINKELKKNKAPSESLLRKTANYVDSVNTGIENGIRISSFWAAVKNGFSVDEAAVIARNVTVDFNQKGNLTQAFGSLYVFFGASVNSMHRFVTTFKRRSPKERRNLIGGIMAASMAVALFNRLMDDDEDEEMPDYDTISTYKRDTNLIIPVPAGLPGFFNDEKDTGYFSMPLPLGYNLFWTMGQVAADFVASSVFNRGGTGLIGGITRVKDSAMNAFNPIGGATLATIGMPTIFTPPMELYANKNFMGRPIRYDDQPFEVPKPAHMQDPKSTPQHWNDLSKAINEFMGGSDVVKGSLAGIGGGNPLEYASDDDLKFDMSGNQMRHILMGYLGGPGQIADSFLGALYTAGSGKESIRTVGDIPILNRFMRATTYGATTRDTFYELRNAVKTAEKAIKTAKEIGPEAYSLVLQDNRKLVQLSSQISALDKQKNKLRRLRNKIEGSKALSEEQKTQRVDEIQKKELNLMVAVIKKAQSLGIS